MKAQHTPGPWYRSADDAISGEPRFIDADNRFIFRLGGMDMRRGTDQANAKLIASAPDLLAALNDTLALARIKWGNLDADANSVFESARAAIAKATAF